MRFSILAVFVFVGCSVAGESDPGFQRLVLETSDSLYVAEEEMQAERPLYGFDLVTRLHNRSGHEVCLNRCYPTDRSPIYYLILIEPFDEFGAAYNAGWACVGHQDPISIAPGHTRTDTIHVQGPHFWRDESEQPHGVLEGTFRLSFEDRACTLGAEEELPDSLFVSNSFEVRLSR